jgi:hypothetical protein
VTRFFAHTLCMRRIFSLDLAATGALFNWE